MYWAIIRKFRCRKSASRWEDKKDGVSQHCYIQFGAVRMMVVTERQFNAIDLLIGEEKTCDLPQNSKQLMEFWKNGTDFSCEICTVFACFQSISIGFSTNRQQKQAPRYCLLYHYEKIQGTTTSICCSIDIESLYHYEKIQGTTTAQYPAAKMNSYTTTRKYRELQLLSLRAPRRPVIPLRENTGNYNKFRKQIRRNMVIPLRENTGNYNSFYPVFCFAFSYTTTRKYRELL